MRRRYQGAQRQWTYGRFMAEAGDHDQDDGDDLPQSTWSEGRMHSRCHSFLFTLVERGDASAPKTSSKGIERAEDYGTSEFCRLLTGRNSGTAFSGRRMLI